MNSAVIIGGGPNEQRVLEALCQTQAAYYGSISDTPATQFRYKLDYYYRYLGDLSGLKDLLAKYRPDHIYITDVTIISEYRGVLQPYIAAWRVVPDIPGLNAYPLQAQKLGTTVVLQAQLLPRRTLSYAIKLGVDRVMAVLLLLLLSPVFLVIFMAIKCSQGGPVLFYQDRLTQDKRVFKLIKFRTMICQAEAETGPVCTQDNDPRILPIGRYLRHWSLDELPQLLNIARGEMSFVGPRPERPYFSEQYLYTAPRFSDRYAVKAGLTGWAQVNGRAYLTDHPDVKLDYDLDYIYNWSLAFDIKILIKTIGVVLKREAVR